MKSLDGGRICGVRARVELSHGKRRNGAGGGRGGGGGGGYHGGGDRGGGSGGYGGRRSRFVDFVLFWEGERKVFLGVVKKWGGCIWK